MPAGIYTPEYGRIFRERYREILKKTQREWYLKNQEIVKARSRDRARRLMEENPDEFRRKTAERAKRWRFAHPEKVKAAKKRRRKQEAEAERKRRAREPQKFRDKLKRWRDKNPDKAKVAAKLSKSKRRARIRNVGNHFTKRDWAELIARSPACYWCKRNWAKTRRPTHDHVIPLSKGGGNTPENSVCACMDCNRSKNARAMNPITGQFILI